MSAFLCSGVEAVSLSLPCVTKLCMSTEIILESAHVLQMSHFCNINVTPNTYTTSPLFKAVVDKGLPCTRHEYHKICDICLSRGNSSLRWKWCLLPFIWLQPHSQRARWNELRFSKIGVWSKINITQWFVCVWLYGRTHVW